MTTLTVLVALFSGFWIGYVSYRTMLKFLVHRAIRASYLELYEVALGSENVRDLAKIQLVELDAASKRVLLSFIGIVIAMVLYWVHAVIFPVVVFEALACLLSYTMNVSYRKFLVSMTEGG